MDKADVIVIGAGVIGLAISARLADKGRHVVAIERHPTFGQETSSRNSEVIHSGIYYKKDSLKASLCAEGRSLLYEFCDKYNVSHKRIGKLIVAVSRGEESDLEKLLKRGQENGVHDIILLNQKEVRRTQPNIEAIAAIESPSTGIVDTHRLMKVLESQAKSKDVLFAYGCEVIGIEKDRDGYKVTIRDADTEELTLFAEVVINSAGFYADKVACMAGIDVENCGYETQYCKGEYFRVASNKAKLVDKLIYPTPKNESLGIHTVSDMQGEMKLGPSAFYVDDINYDVDPTHAVEFYESVRRFLPFIELEDLSPDTSGIRSKIQGEGEEAKDFIISNEADKGLPGLINLIGIESPGLTASLSIAKHVEDMI